VYSLQLREMESVKYASAEKPFAGSEEGGTDEQEKREIEADLEKLAERLVATLSAACSRKKKRSQSGRTA